jgi:hypothetical protein
MKKSLPWQKPVSAFFNQAAAAAPLPQNPPPTENEVGSSRAEDGAEIHAKKRRVDPASAPSGAARDLEQKVQTAKVGEEENEHDSDDEDFEDAKGVERFTFGQGSNCESEQFSRSKKNKAAEVVVSKEIEESLKAYLVDLGKMRREQEEAINPVEIKEIQAKWKEEKWEAPRPRPQQVTAAASTSNANAPNGAGGLEESVEDEDDDTAVDAQTGFSTAQVNLLEGVSRRQNCDLQDLVEHCRAWTANPGIVAANTPAQIAEYRRKIATTRAAARSIERNNFNEDNFIILPSRAQLQAIKTSSNTTPYANFPSIKRVGLGMQEVADFFGFYRTEASKTGGGARAGGRKGYWGDEKVLETRYVAHLLYQHAVDYRATFKYGGSNPALAALVARVLNGVFEQMDASSRPFRVDLAWFSPSDKYKKLHTLMQPQNLGCRESSVLAPGFNPTLLEDLVSEAFQATLRSLRSGEPLEKNDHSRHILGETDFALFVDFARMDLIKAAIKKYGLVYILLTHAHLDHVGPLDAKYLTKLINEGKVVVLLSKTTASLINESENALGLKFLHGAVFREEHLMAPGDRFSVPNTDTELHFYGTAHAHGSLGVVTINKVTGNAMVHTGDQRATAAVCDELCSLLGRLDQRFGGLRVVRAVVDDTNVRFTRIGDAASALAHVKGVLETLCNTKQFKVAILDFTDYLFSSRVAEILVPLAEHLDARVFLQRRNYQVVQALSAVEPLYPEISKICKRDAPIAVVSEEELNSVTGPIYLIHQSSPCDYHKRNGGVTGRMHALEALVQGNKKDTVVVAFQTAGWHRPVVQLRVTNTKFGHAHLEPVSFSEHSGSVEVTEFVTVLKKYGLELDQLTLLTSFGQTMEELKAQLFQSPQPMP